MANQNETNQAACGTVDPENLTPDQQAELAAIEQILETPAGDEGTQDDGAEMADDDGADVEGDDATIEAGETPVASTDDSDASKGGGCGADCAG